jgi:hypothetical protein
MFKIIDCDRLEDGLSRYVVETDDASLFTSLSFLDSLIEFTGSFRYKSKIALRVKDLELTKDVRLLAAQEDRAMILSIYEKTEGINPRERMNIVLRQLREAGRTWMVGDDMIAILKMGRAERKESIARNMEQERKKSA